MLWDHFLLRKEERFLRRIKLLGLILVGLVVLLFLRLAYLQLFEGERYLELSARNRVRLIPIKAQRGLILDRNGEILVGNVPAFAVSMIPAGLPRELDARQKEFDLLQTYLKITPEAIQKKLQHRKWRFFEPIRIQSNIDRETATRLEEHGPELPGVMVLTESRRNYKFGSLAFHALGYVGEISEQELAIRDGYQAGDIIGQMGVEKNYDTYLRGRNGWLHIEVDALGRQMGILGREDPWPGHHVVLTLDRRLQEKAEGVLGKRKGVIIVGDPRNGEILAMASWPTVDPNLFAQGISQEDWDRLRRDKNFPMTNRAIQGMYPPGSIFKIVTLMAALESKSITPDQQFLCHGKFWISTWPYRCWNADGHGLVDMRRAIIESCDIFFYHVGLRIKVELLGEWAKFFGYGMPSGLDLPNDSKGLVPSPEWKEQTQHMPWFPGNTAMFSIGQGYMLGTPMHLFNLIAAVANSGVVYRPHLLKEVRLKSGALVHAVKSEVLRTVQADPQHWKMIQEGLVAVVNSKRGTGKNARLAGIKVAGKTATAQNPHGEDHAGFVAYAPAEAPEVAVVIYLENAGGGGSLAAPLARGILEAYFDLHPRKTAGE